MDLLHNVSDIIGMKEVSGENCQMYLDQPLLSTNDTETVFMPSLSCETLKAVIMEIKSCNLVDLSGTYFSLLGH